MRAAPMRLHAERDPLVATWNPCAWQGAVRQDPYVMLVLTSCGVPDPECVQERLPRMCATDTAQCSAYLTVRHLREPRIPHARPHLESDGVHCGACGISHSLGMWPCLPTPHWLRLLRKPGRVEASTIGKPSELREDAPRVTCPHLSAQATAPRALLHEFELCAPVPIHSRVQVKLQMHHGESPKCICEHAVWACQLSGACELTLDTDRQLEQHHTSELPSAHGDLPPTGGRVAPRAADPGKSAAHGHDRPAGRA